MYSLFSLLPPRAQQYLYYRLYNPPPERLKEQFVDAPLRYAPDVTMDLAFGDVLHGAIAVTGFYELDLTRRVVEVAKKRGGLMVDVGANAGYFSLLWLSQRPENRCILFEPAPRNVALIRRNLEKNGFADRADLRPLALGREAGQMPFDLGPQDQTGWGGLKKDEEGRAITVPVSRLDAEVDELVSFLKIDTEGADAWVIEGGRRLFENKLVDEVRFENNMDRAQSLGISKGEAEAHLRAAGYTVDRLGRDFKAVPT